jgi:hypothetical protein
MNTIQAPVWDDAVAAPAWAGPPLWLHGDLHCQPETSGQQSASIFDVS